MGYGVSRDSVHLGAPQAVIMPIYKWYVVVYIPTFSSLRLKDRGYVRGYVGVD